MENLDRAPHSCGVDQVNTYQQEPKYSAASWAVKTRDAGPSAGVKAADYGFLFLVCLKGNNTFKCMSCLVSFSVSSICLNPILTHAQNYISIFDWHSYDDAS